MLNAPLTLSVIRNLMQDRRQAETSFVAPRGERPVEHPAADAADLPTAPLLRRLHADWEVRRAGRRFPARRDLDPLDLRYILGDLNLIEVLRDPLRFRFRLFGSNIALLLGRDLTGQTLDALPDPDYRELVRSHCAEVAERRAPTLRRYCRKPVGDRVLNLEMLVLPLGEDETRVDMLLVGGVRL